MHQEHAKALSVYEKDFYQNMPVITKNQFGRGYAYYVGTRSDSGFYHKFLEDIFTEPKVAEAMATPEGVEAAIRVAGDREVLFLMNHNEGSEWVVLNHDYSDLLNGEEYRKGDPVEVGAKGVF